MKQNPFGKYSQNLKKECYFHKQKEAEMIRIGEE